MTAWRLPRWTRPRRRGRTISWTSPLTTKLLHEFDDLACLPQVLAILHERSSLRCEPAPPTFALRGLSDRLTKTSTTESSASGGAPQGSGRLGGGRSNLPPLTAAE